jgi:hypothetical protein
MLDWRWATSKLGSVPMLSVPPRQREQCDHVWHISWPSWTNEDVRKHGRQYDLHAEIASISKPTAEPWQTLMRAPRQRIARTKTGSMTLSGIRGLGYR